MSSRVTSSTEGAAALRINAPDATILEHRPIADHTWRIRVACPDMASRGLPGQFAMVRIPDRVDPLLGRPLALYDVDAAHGHVDFVYLVHGRFTSALMKLRVGDRVALWGPLGNGFDLPPVEHLVLVAGGIGQTALLMLAKERLGAARYGLPPREAPRAGRVSMLWGAGRASAFGSGEDFLTAGCEVHLATLDGSTGTRGTVVDLLAEFHAGILRSGDRPSMHLACCGPAPMMAAVAAWSAAQDLGCHASLEEPMACGIGICFTCVARIRGADGGSWDYRRTCVEGPVFDARDVVW
jgi:dihydroorotate dehydrogenase electron transfer subunit